jgi:hypothetical protein
MSDSVSHDEQPRFDSKRYNVDPNSDLCKRILQRQREKQAKQRWEKLRQSSSPKTRHSRKPIGDFVHVSLSSLFAAYNAGQGGGVYVFLMCKHYWDMARQKPVSVSLEDLRQHEYCDISRKGTRTALNALESRGLLQIERVPGQRMVITVIETEESDKVRVVPGNNGSRS